MGNNVQANPSLWYNTVFKKPQIQFEDGSSEYVSLNDISRGTTTRGTSSYYLMPKKSVLMLSLECNITYV